MPHDHDEDKNRYDENGNEHRPHQGYGPAITFVEEDEDGRLWAGNEEYDTQVRFCPFCGYKAKNTTTKDGKELP